MVGGRRVQLRPRCPGSALTRAGSVQRSEVAFQVFGRLVAVGRFLGHQFFDDGGEGGGHASGDLLERLGIFHALLEDLVDDIAAFERRMAGEREVDGAAQAVEVAASVGAGGVGELFGAGVVERADDDVGAGQRAFLAHGAGQAQVEDLGGSLGGDHEVRGLQVAVDQAAVVRGGQAVEHLHEVAGDIGHAHGAVLGVLDQVVQAIARDVFQHHEVDAVGLADFVGTRQVGVLEPVVRGPSRV